MHFQLHLDIEEGNMFSKTLFTVACALALVLVEAKRSRMEGKAREGKLFSLFNIITFENGPCVGSANRNGTCYTSGECQARQGNADGTCASGYGVCCLFIKTCGDTISESCSYLEQPRSIPVLGECTYTICQRDKDICRIRLDFQIFSIANPADETIGPVTTINGAVGDCLTDSFSVFVPGRIGSPQICGFNTGQHMILDASDVCSRAVFRIGAAGFAREWNIKVSQLQCSSDEGGPPGCLQYFSQPSGTVRSFAFPNTNMIGATATHLSNQQYTICFRQELGMCQICFSVAIPGTGTAIDQASFGLSSPTAMALAGAACTSDYITIPGAMDKSDITMRADKLCGRFLTASGTGGISTTVCTKTTPFRLQFTTDGTEMGDTALVPRGTIGFALDFVQSKCP